MATRVFTKADNKPINSELEIFEQVKAKVAEIIKDKEAVISQIRQGFIECVVVFIDLVDSTKFKIENSAEPEKWVLRVKQFGEIINEYIENANGRVVKYIGDEVMGIFDAPTKIDDAMSLVMRINNIENNLTEITGTATKIKIAVDLGNVFLIKYDGHEESDPQGTPIDRCARIGKFCEAGSVLSSYDFIIKTPFPKHWSKIGYAKMKGLGSLQIYQYGEQTIEVQTKIEIIEDEFDKLKNNVENLTEENQELSLENKDLQSTIVTLQEQIRLLGEKPAIETDFGEKQEKEQSEEDWGTIGDNVFEIQKLIDGAGVPKAEYARFLFLKQRNIPEEYNIYSGKTFDASIEKSLVRQDSTDMYRLNMSNKRNLKAIRLIDETERLLQTYVNTHGARDEDDLYEYSFSDSDFWENRIGYNVS